MKLFIVAVYPLDAPGRFIAYLRVYNPEWSACCLHREYAETGAQAKRQAVKTHKATCALTEKEAPHAP